MAAPRPTPDDPGGFALGQVVVDTLETAGIRQTGWRWRYDPALERPTDGFPPHRELAGQYYEGSDLDGWWPGDHNGCLCVAVPVMRGPGGRFVSPDE